jgi:hypothetical protein
MSETRQLLSYLCDKYGFDEGVAVGRASAGIALSLRAWRNSSHEMTVALPSIVCHDVVAAVLAAGCSPIFCDVDIIDGLVPLEGWRQALAQGARALIAVHLYGNPADAMAVRTLCDAAGALLLDDAAQALGSVRNGVDAGAAGHIGVFSFGLTKHIEVGGGVILFKDRSLAHEVRALQARQPASDESVRASALERFRQGQDSARKALRHDPINGRQAFAGLLDGYGSALWPAWREAWAAQILEQFLLQTSQTAERQRKSALWQAELVSSCVVAVGMKEGSVPWRFTCRIPGIDWKQQYQIGQAVRADGHHVSHWYLPAHWLLPQHSSLPLHGSVTLAREVFQFWVTPKVTDAEVIRGAAVFREAISTRDASKKATSSPICS